MKKFINITNLLQMSSVDQSYLGLAIVTSFLSIIGSGMIIITYICLKDKRTQSRKLLFYVSVCNTGSCIGTFLSVGNVAHYSEVSWRSHPTCQAAGAINIVFNMSGYLWTIILAAYLHLGVCWRKDFAKSLMWPAHAICWGYPVAVMVTAILSEVVGSDLGLIPGKHRPPWCFIDRSNNEYFRWKLLAGMGWRMAAMVVCTASYISIQFFRVWKNKPHNEEDNAEVQRSEAEIVQAKKKEYDDKSNRQLSHVLVIFVLINVWATWRFFIEALDASGTDFLVMIEVIGDNAQGVLNFIQLCLCTADVRKDLWISCCTVCCKLRCKCGKNGEIPLPLELEQLRPDEDHNKLLEGNNDTDDEEVQFTLKGNS